MATLPNCVFCRVREAVSREHVVLDGFGGQVEAHRLTCTTCNNGLGRQIDQVLLAKFRDFSVIAGCIRGDGEPVGPVTLIDAQDGGQLRVGAGAREVRRRGEVTVTYPDDHGGQAMKTFVKLDYRALGGFIASRAASRPPGEDALVLSASTVTTAHTDALLAERPFGEAQEFRSVGKMALAAVVQRRGLSRGPHLDAFGRWIATGEGEVTYALDADAGSALRRTLHSEVGVHLLAVLPGDDGGWDAVFGAFGCIPYRIRIPAPLPRLTPFAHIVDPVAHTHRIVDLPGVGLRPLAEVVAHPGDGQGSIAELNAWVTAKAAEARANAPVPSRTVDLDNLAAEITAKASKPPRS